MSGRPVHRWSPVRMALAFTVAVAGVAVEPAAAQQQRGGGRDPEWPCVQVLVPTIAAAMIWPEPPIAPGTTGWRDDPVVRDLAADLAARRTPVEEVEQRTEEFAASLDPEVKDERLTLLFAGALETINRDRASIIAGIKRFARQQRALGEQIRQANATLRRLAAATENDSERQRVRRRELEEQRDWSVRIFDEREGSLTYLCEQPVVLEQRAFALARAIAAQLG